MPRDNSTDTDDERIGLAKLLRNGTAVLSTAFLAASLGFHYISSVDDNEAKSLPAVVQAVKRQDTSGMQVGLAGFGVLLATITCTAQIGLRKARAEADTPDFRP